MFELGKQLTLTNAMSVAQEGNLAIAQGLRTIDLSPLEAVDSSAVAVLLAWQRTANAQGQGLQFTGLSADIQSLMALYGVTEFLQTAHN